MDERAYGAILDLRPMPKPRPRGRGGSFYLPPDFQKWRIDMVRLINSANFPHYEGPVTMHVTYDTNTTTVTLEGVEDDYRRATHVKADLDNLLGGTFEAFQDSGVLDNDSQIVRVHAHIASRKGK
jgi:Holliday junction resolvase RusA-like endonuclease